MNYRRKLKQYAVYWAPLPATDAGQPAYAAPVQIKCRWEVGVQEVINSVGQAWMSKTRVFHTHLTEEGGFLWRGKFSALTSTTDPTLNKDAARINQLDETPNRKATQFLRISYL